MRECGGADSGIDSPLNPLHYQTKHYNETRIKKQLYMSLSKDNICNSSKKVKASKEVFCSARFGTNKKLI
jgi:hypothetical protein